MSGDRVLSEAESIVHSWYNRERNKSKTTHISNPVTSAMDDVITSAFHQASHGNVPAAVDEILNGLRDLPIEDRVMSDMEMYWREKNRDPRLGIEKRQTELKEKKNAREKEKIQSETKNFKPEVSFRLYLYLIKWNLYITPTEGTGQKCPLCTGNHYTQVG